MSAPSELDERLARAVERRLRLQKLHRSVAAVQSEAEEAIASADRLKGLLAAKERDVERLAGASLYNLLASLSGKKDERLRRERQEAVAARFRHDEARARADRLSAELQQIKAEIAGLAGVESEYQSLLAEKQRLIRNDPGRPAANPLESVDRLAEQAGRRLKELEEAKTAGERAGAAVDAVLSAIRSAQSWGIWDILGGGLIATAVKHSRIEESRRRIRDAAAAVSRFRRELKDVTTVLEVPPPLELTGFTVLADYLFDGIIVDIFVQGRINEAVRQAEKVRQSISESLLWVARQTAEVRSEIAGLERERQRHVEEYRA